MATIETLTGVRCSPDRVRSFLKRTGMTCRKVGRIPAKADVVAQAAFKAAELEPRLVEAQAGQRTMFFVDVAPLRPSALSGDALVLYPGVPPGPRRTRATIRRRI